MNENQSSSVNISVIRSVIDSPITDILLDNLDPLGILQLL